MVGVGQSGRDICIDLSAHAKQVYLCNRGPQLQTPIPQNCEQLPGVLKVTSKSVCFLDGQERHVDSLILATGYNYSFPFLPKETGIRIQDGKRVTPLYYHTFNSLHPSMAFIGINFGYNPFPFFDYQVRWVLSVWSGHKSLPSMEDMMREEEEWYRMRLQQGIPPHKASHYLGPYQWELMDVIARLAGVEPLPRVMEKLYNEVFQQRQKNLLQYRSHNYVILDGDRWAPVK